MGIDCEQQISLIMERNQDAFKSWVDDNSVARTLDFAEEVIKVFVPRRILEMADDPSKVRVLVKEKRAEYLGFLVYEHLDQPQSDPDLWERWCVENPRGLAVRDNPYTSTEAPLGLDYLHVSYHRLLREGKLNVNDKIFLDYMAAIDEGFPDVVKTVNLYDRPELHRQGVGTSFYQRVEDVFRYLQFKYLAEQIISPHPDFFRKKGSLFQDLPTTIRAELPSYLGRSPGGFDDVKWVIRVL